MRNRIELAQEFRRLGFTVGAEIGVHEGTYSKELCQANPGLKLYSIDPWKAHEGYRDIKKLSTFSNAHEQAVRRLKPYGCILIRKMSLDAVKDFEDNSLDFVYIDGNHSFDWVMRDIIEWTHKVRKNGIVSGHDYTDDNKVGVKDAVDAYAKNHTLRLNITDEQDHLGFSWYFRKRWNG